MTALKFSLNLEIPTELLVAPADPAPVKKSTWDTESVFAFLALLDNSKTKPEAKHEVKEPSPIKDSAYDLNPFINLLTKFYKPEAKSEAKFESSIIAEAQNNTTELTTDVEDKPEDENKKLAEHVGGLFSDAVTAATAAGVGVEPDIRVSLPKYMSELSKINKNDPDKKLLVGLLDEGSSSQSLGDAVYSLEKALVSKVTDNKQTDAKIDTSKMEALSGLLQIFTQVGQNMNKTK